MPAATDGDTGQTTSAADSGSTESVAQDGTTQAVQQTPQKGEPPRERWDSILENAREKVRTEEFGWAKGVDRQEFESARSWLDLANQNPMQALDRFVRTIATSNEGKQALRSYMGRMLGQRPAAAPQQGQQSPGGEDTMPGPDIPTSESNGQPVVYSASRMHQLLEWQQRQLMTKFGEQLQPFQEDREQRQAREAQERQAAQHRNYADVSVSALEKKPGFKEHKAEIVAVYSAIPVHDPRSEGEKLRDAYDQVVGSKRDTITRQQTVDDIRRKAGANTVPANSSAPPAPFDHKKATWAQSFEHEWNKRKNAAQ